jgi:FAD dependent oxidoreductase
MKIAVIGAGWYGCHIARILKKSGHEVILFEKAPDIFSNISGKFGIRLHAGPHYPRSQKTRNSCHQGFEEFYKTYPELIIEHEYSIYGLGNKDADGEPPKIDRETFNSVCKESKTCQEINPEERGYRNLIAAVNINEPSIVIGTRLRETFKKYLKDENIKLITNVEIKKFEKCNDKVAISVNGQLELFDFIVNATSCYALLPAQPFPFNIDIVYQPCLALVYEDKKFNVRPFSFIVMDGWFPCLMPYGDPIKEVNEFKRHYIMTHGKWTITGSFKTVIEFNETNEDKTTSTVSLLSSLKPNYEQTPQL